MTQWPTSLGPIGWIWPSFARPVLPRLNSNLWTEPKVKPPLLSTFFEENIGMSDWHFWISTSVPKQVTLLVIQDSGCFWYFLVMLRCLNRHTSELNSRPTVPNGNGDVLRCSQSLAYHRRLSTSTSEMNSASQGWHDRMEDLPFAK
jgi:hypothetical protein